MVSKDNPRHKMVLREDDTGVGVRVVRVPVDVLFDVLVDDEVLLVLSCATNEKSYFMEQQNTRAQA